MLPHHDLRHAPESLEGISRQQALVREKVAHSHKRVTLQQVLHLFMMELAWAAGVAFAEKRPVNH